VSAVFFMLAWTIWPIYENLLYRSYIGPIRKPHWCLILVTRSHELIFSSLESPEKIYECDPVTRIKTRVRFYIYHIPYLHWSVRQTQQFAKNIRANPSKIMQSVLKEFLCVEMKSPTLLIILGWVFLSKICENVQKKYRTT
jgi:hypothetical protein